MASLFNSHGVNVLPCDFTIYIKYIIIKIEDKVNKLLPQVSIYIILNRIDRHQVIFDKTQNNIDLLCSLHIV